MTKKRPKSLLTISCVRKLHDSLVEAVGVKEDQIANETARNKTKERALRIVRMAGGDLARTSKNKKIPPVLHYTHLIHFVNVNRKRLHKFVLLPEPYADGPYQAIYVIPSEVAEKVLVLGWPRPEDG